MRCRCGADIEHPLDVSMTLVFEVTVELTAVERDVVGRVGEFLGSLMAAWQSSTPEKRKEAILELQGDLNDLRDLNLTLAIGSAEQQLLPPENLPSKPIPVTTLAATRMRRGHRPAIGCCLA